MTRSIAAKRLSEFRSLEGMSLRAVAEKIGVTKVTVFDYERGAIRPVKERRRAIYRLTKGYVLPSQWEKYEAVEEGARR